MKARLWQKGYYARNRYELCKKKMDIYIPQAINRVRGMMPERVSEYLEQYAYDEHIKLYTRYVLKKMGVKANRDYYDDCISNTHYGYIYSICMCAQHGYTGTHVSNYIKRMISVTIICGINTFDEARQICQKNNLSVKYLDDDRK